MKLYYRFQTNFQHVLDKVIWPNDLPSFTWASHAFMLDTISKTFDRYILKMIFTTNSPILKTFDYNRVASTE